MDKKLEKLIGKLMAKLTMSSADPFVAMQEIIERANKNEAIKAKVANWNRVFQFKPKDSDPFYLSISQGALELKKGTHDKPDSTLEASSSDFVAIFKGELEGTQAFLTGKLKISGNIMATQDLNSVLRMAMR